MTEAQTLTLTDFLLARIAEDEAAVRALLDFDHWVDGAAKVRPGDVMARVGRWEMTPARVLAECEAKRRIVEYLRQSWDVALTPAAGILQALALPYADHPDYRDEWHP